MDKEAAVRKTDKGFQLGCQHKGEDNPRWYWLMDQKMIAELWFMGIKCVPGKGDTRGDSFSCAVYADSHVEAWYAWENKLAPWLLAGTLAQKAS